jgi:hypothetical protein
MDGIRSLFGVLGQCRPAVDGTVGGTRLLEIGIGTTNIGSSKGRFAAVLKCTCWRRDGQYRGCGHGGIDSMLGGIDGLQYSFAVSRWCQSQREDHELLVAPVMLLLLSVARAVGSRQFGHGILGV